jgi:DNA-binding IscR family transcriptional regulator
MLRLSRKTILALEAVVDIACNSRPEPVQSKEIMRRQGGPVRRTAMVACISASEASPRACRQFVPGAS